MNLRKIGTHPEGSGLLVQRETGRVVENVVRRQKDGPGLNCAGSDPKIIGIAAIMKRVASHAASVTKPRDSRQQCIADRDDSGGLDRGLEAVASLVPPFSASAP